MIPYGRQEISEKDIQAVVDVLRSDFLTQGPLVPAFEQAVAKFAEARFGIAVNSATSALHIACLALGVGPGDVVWTTPITFVACSNWALYCGARVDFVDIDPVTYNISVATLEKKLAQAEKSNTLPKVVIPVHLAGQPCDMSAIFELSKKYNFRIIEDASHAIGGKYKGEPIGNCRYSDITVFSFHPVKIITSGEGGMLMTNDNVLASKLGRLRSHGITRHPEEMTHTSDGPWYYQQLELGYNYRMTDIQAALGLSQMDRIEEFVAKRHVIAKRYDELLSQDLFTIPFQHPDSYSGLHLYIVRLKLDKISISQRNVFENLRNNGILANLHYIPVYKHPYYQSLGFDSTEFPEAEKYYSEAISIPMFPGLTEAEQDEVIARLTSPSGHQNLF